MGPSNTASRPQSYIASITSSIINIIRALIVNTYTAIFASINAVLPPQKRAEIQSQLTAFARERPILASLLASQAIFCGIPLALFVLQIVSVLIFSFTTALVLASLCAITFTAVCTGLAFLVLVPVLAVATCAGLAVWCWGWVAWWALVTLGFLQTASTPGRVRAVKNDDNIYAGKQRKVDGFNGVDSDIPTL